MTEIIWILLDLAVLEKYHTGYFGDLKMLCEHESF
jgi:hypothetical protein